MSHAILCVACNTEEAQHELRQTMWYDVENPAYIYAFDEHFGIIQIGEDNEIPCDTHFAYTTNANHIIIRPYESNNIRHATIVDIKYDGNLLNDSTLVLTLTSDEFDPQITLNNCGWRPSHQTKLALIKHYDISLP